jgi:hypothetical protein
MPNKNLLIAMGVAVLILAAAIIYRVNEDKKEEADIPNNQIIIDDSYFLDEEEIDEVMVVFRDVESSFYSINEQIFLMGDDVVEMLSDDITEIEEGLSRVKVEIEEGVQDRDVIYENITNIQKKIQDLTEKLIELHS